MGKHLADYLNKDHSKAKKLKGVDKMIKDNTTSYESITGRIPEGKIQKHAIELLKHYGADEDRLWLCEAQPIERCAAYYGEDFVIKDLTADRPEDNTHILYYHENGYIAQSATFNPDNAETLKEAAKFVANHM